MLEVEIITPHGLYKKCTATMVSARSMEGEFALLEHHMPIVAMLEISELILHDGETFKEYAISGGMFQYLDNKVTILTDSIEGEEEIDMLRANEAKERAEKRLLNQDSDINMRRAEIALQKAINRIHVKQNIN